jgi:hypothetical protein
MADEPRVGLLVPNLFLRVPIEAAIRGAGAQPVFVADAKQAHEAGCKAAVLDLDVAGADPSAIVGELTRAGIAVLAFGPHVEAEKLASARRAGAVALARSAFLGRLPELIASALRRE